MKNRDVLMKIIVMLKFTQPLRPNVCVYVLCAFVLVMWIYAYTSTCVCIAMYCALWISVCTCIRITYQEHPLCKHIHDVLAAIHMCTYT